MEHVVCHPRSLVGTGLYFTLFCLCPGCSDPPINMTIKSDLEKTNNGLIMFKNTKCVEVDKQRIFLQEYQNDYEPTMFNQMSSDILPKKNILKCHEDNGFCLEI